MNLQELRDKQSTMECLFDTRIIEQHIENTILHFLQSDCSELEPEGDWADVAMAKIRENGENETLIYNSYVDANYYFVGGIDIWLTIDYSIEVCWDGDSYPEITDVMFDKIQCYWMDMEFDLIKSDAIQTLIRKEISEW